MGKGAHGGHRGGHRGHHGFHGRGHGGGPFGPLGLLCEMICLCGRPRGTNHSKHSRRQRHRWTQTFAAGRRREHRSSVDSPAGGLCATLFGSPPPPPPPPPAYGQAPVAQNPMYQAPPPYDG